MDIDAIDRILAQTLEDRTLSRGEKKALAQVLGDEVGSERDLEVIRSRSFALAAAVTDSSRAREVLEWLEDVVRTLSQAREHRPEMPHEEAHFSPGQACARRIVGLMSGARNTLDICVFTITDNSVATAVLEAHRRGVKVRIITDDLKATDRGSDIDLLEEAGIPLVVDGSPAHMHHKFAVADGRTVLTGSYNWTRSAAEENFENLVLSDHPTLVSAFTEEFERLWRLFGGR